MREIKQKSLVYKIFIGFLIPYVLINGLIFFFIVSKPHINIITDTTSTKNDHVRFNVQSILPIIKLSVTKDEKPIEYIKDGNDYIIPITSNGGIKIEATSINRATTPTFIEVNTIDDVSPVINIEDATFALGTLTITVTDNDSGINYDEAYGTTNGKTIKPIFIDKSTGTLKFKVDKGLSITIHIEDNIGNTTETTFEAN
ncbi:MAG: hypothetical protein MJ151_01855 [Lachnospiraceae bacterium]|nr:hypothetical protein [Lachnospiraceae bacterium]